MSYSLLLFQLTTFLLWSSTEAHLYLTDPAPRAVDDAVYTFSGVCEGTSCDSFCGSYAYGTGPVTTTQPGAYTVRVKMTQAHSPYQVRVSFNGQNVDGNFDSTSLGIFDANNGESDYEFEVTLPDDADCYDQPCVLQVYDMYYFVSCANVQYSTAEWTCDDISNVENYVIDVRTENEWNSGHVGCAHLLTLSSDFTEENLEYLTNGNKDAKIILYCRSGNRAGVAKNMAIGWGYTNVVNAMGYTDIVAAGCGCEAYSCANAHSASWADWRYIYVAEQTIVRYDVAQYFCECMSTRIETGSQYANAPKLVSLDNSQFSLSVESPLEDAKDSICAMSMGRSECSSCTLANPFETVAPCPRWCGTNAQPWSEKCSQFDSCKVCSMCDTIETDTDEPTLEPTNRLLTAVPTLEPTTGERRNTGQCFGWCANNGNPWSVKCFEYLKCSGCKECEQFDNTTEEEPSFEPTFEPTVQSETDEPTFEPTVQSETDEPTLEPTVQNETDEPTFEPTVRGPCVAWCAKSGVPWESKCGWPKCLGCDECFEEPEEPEEPEDDGICENWCASSPVGWNQGKCRWGKCEGCAECKATLEPTVEPTLEPEDPATFSPTKEPTLEPEDPADSDDCTRCVELVKENHKCNKGVPMNGSPRVSSSDTCGPEALQQCITQSSKAECAEVYFSFRMDGENGACVYSSADECVTDSGIGVRTNHPWEIYTYNCCVEPEETTAKPTEEPEETRSCPGWCQAHGAPWSTKCTFNACKVCVRCT